MILPENLDLTRVLADPKAVKEQDEFDEESGGNAGHGRNVKLVELVSGMVDESTNRFDDDDYVDGGHEEA